MSLTKRKKTLSILKEVTSSQLSKKTLDLDGEEDIVRFSGRDDWGEKVSEDVELI